MLSLDTHQNVARLGGNTIEFRNALNKYIWRYFNALKTQVQKKICNNNFVFGYSF